jgi:hypothetical protein
MRGPAGTPALFLFRCVYLGGERVAALLSLAAGDALPLSAA